MPSGANYTPPGQTEESPAERDPEAGQPNKTEESSKTDPNLASSPPETSEPTSARVDLLDDVEAGHTPPSDNGTIHELD